MWALPAGEIAVNTLHFKHLHVEGNTLDWAGDMTQRYANLVRDALVSVRQQLQGYHHSTASLQRVDAYHLGTDGLTIDKRTALFDGTNTFVGAGTTAALPHQLAAVVSLYGYNPQQYDPLGSRKRGRIYLPALHASILSAGVLNDPAGLATAWKNAVSYMQNRPMDSGFAQRERAQLVILSKRWQTTTPVTHVRCDQLLDVQKRRISALKPAPQFAAVVPQA